MAKSFNFDEISAVDHVNVCKKSTTDSMRIVEMIASLADACLSSHESLCLSFLNDNRETRATELEEQPTHDQCIVYIQ